MIHPIKDTAKLDESYRDEDLFNVRSEISLLERRIQSITTNAILGVVGKHGSGKTTSLNQVQKKLEDTDWINFEAWEHPDRQNLWEGLVLSIAKEHALLEITARRIDQGGAMQTESAEKTAKFLDIASMAPGMDFLSKVRETLGEPPAKRLFQVQRILVELIESFPAKRVVIVVEDIDRSGEHGLFFLETLSNFIKHHTIAGKQLLVIAPIADAAYYQDISTYIKCLDFTDFFKPKQLNSKAFVEAIFSNDIEQRQKQQLKVFLEGAFAIYSDLNPRVLKTILRDFAISFDQQCREGWNPDWRVTLCLTFAKYYNVNKRLINGETPYIFDSPRGDDISRNLNKLLASFLEVIVQPTLSIYTKDASGLRFRSNDTRIIIAKQQGFLNNESIRKNNPGENPGIYINELHFK